MPPSECKECTAKLVQIDDIIKCQGGCGGVFCLKCSNIKRTELKFMSDNTNLKWFCNECSLSNTNTKFVEIKLLIEKKQTNALTSRDIKDGVEQVIIQKFTQMKNNLLIEMNSLIERNIEEKLNNLKTEILNEISKSLKENNNKLTEICNQRHNNENVNKQMSYAEAAKQKQIQKENNIVIKPKNKSKNNKETKNALKSVIEPTDGLVSAVREIQSGGLLVQSKDTETRDRVQQKIVESIGEEYKLEEPRDKSDYKKVFKLIGMTDELSKERLVECISKQNDICKNKMFNVIKIYINPNRREMSYNALIETDGLTYNTILKQRRLNVEWDSCIVFDHVSILRCFKCLGYNHKSNECVNKLACGRCAGNHCTKECNSNILKCVNCSELVKKKLLDTDVNHEAFSRSCPAYIKYYEKRLKPRK